MIEDDNTTLCGCMKCTGERFTNEPIETRQWPGPNMPGWRYSCEKCGNKRCPHHSDHTLACTNSNEPGQPGSLF